MNHWLWLAPALATAGMAGFGVALRRQVLGVVAVGLAALTVLGGLLDGWAEQSWAGRALAVAGAGVAVVAADALGWVIDGRRRGVRSAWDPAVRRRRAEGVAVAAAVAVAGGALVALLASTAPHHLAIPLAVAGLAGGVAAAAMALTRLGVRPAVGPRPARTLATAAALVPALAALVAIAASGPQLRFDSGPASPAGVRADTASPATPLTSAQPPVPEADPRDAPWSLGSLAIVALAAFVILLVYALRDGVIPPEDLVPDREAPPELPPLGDAPAGADRMAREAVIGSVADALAHLRSDLEPRLAVRVAYATLTAGLGSDALRQAASESEEEYLERVLGDVGVSGASLARLTALFERARFSTEPITMAMRDDAVAALAEVRYGVLAVTQQGGPGPGGTVQRGTDP
jgi:hypothetical protein